MDSYLERLRQELEDAIGGSSPSALARAAAGNSEGLCGGGAGVLPVQ